MAGFNDYVRDQLKGMEAIGRDKIVQQFMASIDWAQLREQKASMQKMITTIEYLEKSADISYNPRFAEARTARKLTLQGMQHFLNVFSDLAVDHFGVDEELVFGKEADEA